MNNAQTRFVAAFITSADICKQLACSRYTIHKARKRGVLPQGFPVGGLYVWAREEVADGINKLSASLTAHRTARK